MQLRRLDVVNIRSFESGRLDLSPGTTLLVGDVGAGKSSLLYAVEMALFGVAEVDAAFLVRHGTSHAEVGVTLADTEHTYTLRRRFRKVRRRGRETYEPERLTFAEDGRPTAYSATEIRQRVIELVGFPDNPNPHAHSDLWRWAIYVPQERMREILAANPEERLETIRKALGVERYRTAAENAQALAADLRLSGRRRREEAARLGHWDVEFAEASREADQLRLERVALAEGVRRDEEVLVGARNLRQVQETVAARLEADRRELEALRREEAGDAARVAEVTRRRETTSVELGRANAEATTLRPIAGEAPSLHAARAAAEQALRERRAELERSSEGLQQLARAIAALEAAERRRGEATDLLGRSQQDRDRAAEQLAEAVNAGPSSEPPAPTARSLGELEQLAQAAVTTEHTELDALARARARLDQVAELLQAGVCPTCHQAVHAEEFESHREEAARAVELAEASRARAAELRTQLELERKARERYERAHDRWAEVERRRREARERLGHRDDQLAAAMAAVDAARQEAEALREAVSTVRPVEAATARQREAVAAAEAETRRLQDNDERASRAEVRLGALAELTERLTRDVARLSTELEAASQKGRQRLARLSSLEQGLSAAEASTAALESARSAEAAAERRLADARGALVRTDTRLDGVVARITSAERGRAERAALVVEATDFEAKAAWAGEPFRLRVLRMEKELLAHAQTAFDRAFSRYFASLVDDPTLVARTDVTFTPEVTIAGEATPAEALSGGERTGLALAFRLALASVVRALGAVRLETLLLDEPTDGFSAEQVVRMGELLEELALPQVVLVSHESGLTAIADRTVRVVKVDGRSTLERSDPGPARDDPPSPLEPPAREPRPEPASRAPAPSP